MSSPAPGSDVAAAEVGQQASPAQEPLDNFLNLEFWPAEQDYQNDPADTMQWLQQLDHMPPGAEEQAAPGAAAAAAPALAQRANTSSGCQGFQAHLLGQHGGDGSNQVS